MFQLCCLKQIIRNARLPNELRNGLTVGMGIYAAFGKDWVVAITLLLQSLSPAGWQGVALYILNISFKEKVNQEIQLEQTWNLVNTSQMLLPLSYWTCSRSKPCNSQARFLS